MNERADEGIFAFMESEGSRIRDLRSSLGMTQQAFADMLGVTRGAVGNWELNKGIKKENLQSIALQTGTPLEWLAFGSGAAPILPARIFAAGSDISRAASDLTSVEVLGERDLKVFAAVEGGDGEMVINADPIDIVQRPWYLKNVRDGYAVLVVGDSMIPAFEPGDIAVVNPRLPPMKNVDMIFIAGDERGEFRASIKRLLRWSPDEWFVLQFNPALGKDREFALSRDEWPKALRVVGKYYGR